MERFSDENILNMVDTLNQRLRRVLGYHTPSELFLMQPSMKFILLSVFPDYGCLNSTCNLPIEKIPSITKTLEGIFLRLS